jgi:UDP-N-acetylmuramoyl-tripeptide--D-alanyl-D-alanine ligase
VRAAIDLLAGLRPEGEGRKYLVLGDMLELGPDEAEFHAGIGRRIAPDKADALLAFGPLSRHIADAASPAFPPGAVRHFEDKKELAAELLARLGPDDLVLVKGSRGMRLEEVVAALQRGAVD